MSPARTVPPVTTRTYMPRIRIARPAGVLIQRSASAPNRALNTEQPVCGRSVTSSTAVADRQPRPDGQVLRREVQVQVELVAGKGPACGVRLDGGQHARAHRA